MRPQLFLLVLVSIGRRTNCLGDHVTSIPMSVAKTAGEDSATSLPINLDGRSKSDRFLRGGSYSRGGSSSSYHSSSSSYNHNNSNSRYNNQSSNKNYRRNGSSFMGRFFTGLAIAGIGLLALGMVFGTGSIAACCLPLLCCFGAAGAAAAANASGSGPSGNYYVNQCGDGNPNYCTGGNNNNNDQFQNRVQQTKGEVENMGNTAYQQNNNSAVQPFSGQYTTSFVDPESGTHHNASISIFFTPDPHGNGYRINGQGGDIDGNTVIEDGFANDDGNAWWIEKNINGDLSLQVLSKGKFNFYQHAFEGTWLANTMLGGPYLSFAAAAATNQTFNNSYQSPSDIPIVVATPEPEPTFLYIKL